MHDNDGSREFFTLKKFFRCVLLGQLISVLYILCKDAADIQQASKEYGILPTRKGPGLKRIRLPDVLLNSQWIEYFPHFKAFAGQFNKIPPLRNITSAKESVVAFAETRKYVIGDTLSAYIQAKNGYGTPKQHGGDFFRVSLHQLFSTSTGVSCDVRDSMNGRYLISCPLLWSGSAHLYVILIHPSESLYGLVKNSSGATELGVSLKATLNNTKTKEQELVECAFGFPGSVSDAQLCDYSNPRNGEPWLCKRPSFGECPRIAWMDRYYDDEANEQTMGKRPYFTAKINWRVALRSPMTIKVSRSLRSHEKRQKSCARANTADIPLEPMQPTGWLDNGRWISFLCDNRPFHVETFGQCLRNHTMYLLGDSTVRQWYNFLVEEMSAEDVGTDGPDIWAQARNGYSEKYNIHLHYRAHGPPLHNPGTVKVRPYITDTLAEIAPGAQNTIVLFTIGLHMDLFHPDIYLHRIRGIRDALVSLRKKAPDVRVFVRGHHVHAQTTRICPSDWLSYRHDVLLRRVFLNVTGVMFIPLWDMTAVFRNGPYHPNKLVLNTEIGLFQSFLCPA